MENSAPAAPAAQKPVAPPAGQPFTLNAAVRYAFPDRFRYAPNAEVDAASADLAPLLAEAGYQIVR